MSAKPKQSLPPGVVAEDLKWPGYDTGKDNQVAQDVADHGQLQFYEVIDFGWCVATLDIARGRNGRAARTYAVRVEDGKSCRVGNGPHVKQVLTVYVRRSRVAALQKYLDLYQSGAVEANQIRDRISTRRAQGALRRGASGWGLGLW